MEEQDISKELEKEFAQTRPKPYKRTKDTRVLIIDDFGLVKSGQYLKSIIRVLFVVSLVSLVGTILFLSLYVGVLSSAGKTKNDLKLAEKKVAALVQEKEMLMARLVLEGKKPLTMDGQAGRKTLHPEVGPGLTEKWTKGGDLDQTVSGTEDKANLKGRGRTVDSTTPKDKNPKIVKNDNNPDKAADSQSTGAIVAKQTIAVEKFTVKKDQASGDLLVRFDIKNVSGGQGEVSGRVFTVLKPDIQNRGNWLVVPLSNLEKGMPSEPGKGQYFSIAHFKPMKFRIKTSADPGAYKFASIYIFNDDAQMIAQKQINITDAE